MKLSIIIPTYNNDKTIDACLKSLSKQDFPKKEYEILVIDGGSTDSTRDIAKKYGVKLLHNPYRVEDKARVIALNESKADIIALIDADNVVIGKDWIKKMLKPFEDPEISYADTMYFSYRKSDAMKVRYQALIGGDDPLATYLGFYSRWCYFKNDWTDFPHKQEKKEGYWKYHLTDKESIPTIGSNGFLARKELFLKYFSKAYLHPDYIYDMVNDGYNCGAKVNTSIVHNQPTFFKNKARRIMRRLNKEVNIRYHYNLTPFRILSTFLYIVLILPLIKDVIIGYYRKPDSAWLFHFPACFGLVGVHSYYRCISFSRSLKKLFKF